MSVCQLMMYEDRKRYRLYALLGALIIYGLFVSLFFLTSQPSKIITLHVNPGQSAVSSIRFLSRIGSKNNQKTSTNVKDKSAIEKTKNNSPLINAKNKMACKQAHNNISQAAQKISRNGVIKKNNQPQKNQPGNKIKKSVPLSKDVVKKVPPQPIAQKKEPAKKNEPHDMRDKKHEQSQKTIKQECIKTLHKNDSPELFLFSGTERCVQGREAIVQVALSRAIARQWKPPRGAHENLMAEFHVSIKSNGVVDSVVMNKQSGVLVYDLAARGALCRSEYPKELWGTTIIIAFGGKL